jgi:hypothetical protein
MAERQHKKRQKTCGCEASKCGGKVPPKHIGLGGSGWKHVFLCKGLKKFVGAENFVLKTTIAHTPAWTIIADFDNYLGHEYKKRASPKI